MAVVSYHTHFLAEGKGKWWSVWWYHDCALVVWTNPLPCHHKSSPWGAPFHTTNTSSSFVSKSFLLLSLQKAIANYCCLVDSCVTGWLHVIRICPVSLCFSHLQWENLVDVSTTEPEAEVTQSWPSILESLFTERMMFVCSREEEKGVLLLHGEEAKARKSGYIEHLRRMTLPPSLDPNPRTQAGPQSGSRGILLLWMMSLSVMTRLKRWAEESLDCTNLHLHTNLEAERESEGASPPGLTGLGVRFNKMGITFIPTQERFVYQLSTIWILLIYFLVTIFLR